MRVTAAVIGVVAVLAFAAVRFAVAGGDEAPLPIDLWWAELIAPGEVDALVILAWVPGIGGGTIAMIVILVAGVGLFLWRRRPWDAANLGTAIIVVVAIGAPMSFIIARHRPEGSLAETTVASFPSGHTAVATTFVITLTLLLRRWWIAAAGIVWVILMMWSRTYLSAHWLTDVTAGLFEGIAVGTLIWALYEQIKAVRAKRRENEVAQSTGEGITA